MSDSKLENSGEVSGSEAVRMEAADWILRQRMAEDWTENDQAELLNWREQSTSHLLAYLRLEAAWKQTDRLVALRTPMRTIFAPASRRFRRPSLALVAVLLAVTGVAVALTRSYREVDEGHRFSTGVGGHKQVTLADGSIVELNTNTVIRLSSEGATRTAYLDKGEAYFRIAHDPAHPFVVIAGNRRVIDVGTTFVVRREPKALSVTLIEGKARFDTPADQSSPAIELRPGDEVVATAAGVDRIKKSQGQMLSELGWRSGNLVFSGTSLAEAAANFNRYNRTKLVVTDPRVGRLRINGTFAANNAQAFVDATQVVLGLRLETRPNEILISK